TALKKLLAIKARDPAKGLILIAASIDQLAPWIQPLGSSALQRIGDSWPGPVTWILPASKKAPEAVTGGRPTVAARVSAHPPVVELCRAARTAIISTSANLSGKSPARHADDLTDLIGLDACLDAQIGELKGPTPIFDLQTGTQLRS
ncbi:MAG: L-threonylcarbamoyladenylate synthase, partial [Granulosicoccaceae bacterium]